MADVKWIKIMVNVFDDEKMKLIDVLPERDAIIVIWFKLLALAGKTNDNGLVYIMKEMATTDEVLSTVFNRPLPTIRLALETFVRFGMIQMNDHINIVNWEKHQNVDGLEKIREQAKKRQAKYREKQKQLKPESCATLSVTSRNSTEEEEEEEEDKTYSAFFEKCWKLYPNKKGKGTIKNAGKKKIHKLGEEFERCIERYKKDTEIRRKEFPELNYQNGSTFFNSGYVDYLDENYEEAEIKVKEKSIEQILGYE